MNSRPAPPQPRPPQQQPQQPQPNQQRLPFRPDESRARRLNQPLEQHANPINPSNFAAREYTEQEHKDIQTKLNKSLGLNLLVIVMVQVELVFNTLKVGKYSIWLMKYLGLMDGTHKLCHVKLIF